MTGAAAALRSESLIRVARVLVIFVAIGAGALYPIVAGSRIGHPFELEWMEGGTMAMAVRAAAGEPVYVAPSVDYIPFNYTPLYLYAAAPLIHAFGAGLGTLRALSFAASLATMLLLIGVVLRLTSNWRSALLSGCLFAASHALTGTWYDLARPDSLHMLLLGAGLSWLLLDRSAWRAGIAAGLLIGLAHFAKQSAILSVIPFVVVACLQRRAVGWVTAGTLAATVVIGSWSLETSTHGWFSYYTMKVAAGHPVEVTRIVYFAMRIAAPLAVAVTIGLGWFAFAGSTVRASRTDVALLAGGPVLASTYMCLYPYSGPNVAIPGVFAIALLFGLGWDAIGRRIEGIARDPSRVMEALLLVACMLQFAGLAPDPRKSIPTRADRRAGEQLVERIRRENGTVLAPAALEIARLAGKPTTYHRMALADMELSGRPEWPRVASAVREGLVAKRWSVVILDRSERSLLDSIHGYGPEETLFPYESDLLWTRTGPPTRPEFLRRAFQP